ncbi:MAG: hypothetical protein WBF33_12505 [Candidatus Nitrosopolaris sp.]|jgi:hypothetical protein
MSNLIEMGKKLQGTAWLAGNASCLLLIPKPLAKQYGIDEPSNVVIEGRPEGILIRKVEALEVAPNSATNAPEIIQSPKEILPR